jgi:hypothetical protein
VPLRILVYSDQENPSEIIEHLKQVRHYSPGDGEYFLPFFFSETERTGALKNENKHIG